MKRIFAVAIALLVLAGCGQTGPDSLSLPQNTPPSAPPAEYMICRILYQTEESLLLTQEENGEETGDLILLSPLRDRYGRRTGGNQCSMRLSWKRG